MNENNKHIFAIYLENLSKKIINSKNILINDVYLKTRLTNVLRLQPNEEFILFDDRINVLLSLNEETLKNKNSLFATLISTEKNKQFKNQVVLAPALLKKEDFETAVYFAAEMGADIIQPVLTSKVQRKWHGDKELERLYKIIISACEQSKNFSMPSLLNPISFEEFEIKTKNEFTNHKKIFFEDSTNPLIKTLNELDQNKEQDILLHFGPEGGLTNNEMERLKDLNFNFVSLTSTILKATDAIALGLGCIRSIVN